MQDPGQHVSMPAGWAPQWAMPQQATPQDPAMAQAAQQAIMPAAWNQVQATPQQQAMPVALAQPQTTRDGMPVAWTQASAAQWVAAPMPTAIPQTATVAAPVTRHQSGGERAADLLLRLALVVAMAGVAFSVGRATAPKTASTAGFPTGFAGFGNQGTGTTPGDGSGNGAVVVPQASGNPTTNDQVAAPSGAPVVPSTGDGTGTNNGGTGQGGFPGGGFPGAGGFGGLTGTVSAVGDGTVSYITANGQTVQVATTADTTYHQQQAASAADITLGSTVRITVGGDLGGGGQPGGGNGTPSLTASNVELVPASGSSQAQGQGLGAFGSGGLTGTVATIGEGSIGITTSSGQTLDVATSADTTYTQQADASASAVSPGVSVRITTAGGFPGGGLPGGGQPPTGSFDPAQAVGGAGLTAADIEVLVTAGQ
jgi:preprotein translocase subunit YajC